MFNIFRDLVKITDSKCYNQLQNLQKNKTNSLEDLVLQIFREKLTEVSTADLKKEESNRWVFTPQPYGSQKFPDFLAKNNGIEYKIECKSSKTGKPMWNCTFPEPDINTWYIFLRITNFKIQILPGTQLITRDLYNALMDVKRNDELKDLRNKINTELRKLNEFSNLKFSYYIRDMFNQVSNIDYDQVYPFPDEPEESITTKWLSKTDKVYRNQHGQFFTGDVICEYISSVIETVIPAEFEPRNILEPSFGSGELIELYELNQEKRPENEYYNEDFLLNINDTKYDYILANPPYNELNKIPDPFIYNEKYSDYIEGKSNIYFLFIKKSFDMLSENGIMTFIIPNTFKSSISCHKIRNYILSKSEILDIRDMGKFDSEVAQDVMCLTIKKSDIPSNDFVCKVGEFNYISLVKHNISSTRTMRDLDISISIGKVVWNQHKDKLTDNKDDPVLLYSENVTINGIHSLKSAKHQHIQHDDKFITKAPCLLVRRAVSKANNYIPICCLIKKSAAIENHLFVISGSNTNLLKAYKSLINPKTGIYIESIVGSVHLSVSNILNLPLID